MPRGPWDENGEAYQTRDGRIISLRKAQREGHEIRRPFDNGYAELRDGVLYPDRNEEG
jgi:hypothetical protein